MIDSSSLPEVSDKIAKLLVTSKAYNQATDFVNLDLVWQSPTYLQEFSVLLSNYIKLIPGSTKYQSIVATHNLQVPYGIVPIAALVSVRLSIPLAIWEEAAVPLVNNALVSGHLSDKHVLILHDVIRQGGAVAKTMIDLVEAGVTPEHVLSVVDAETDKDTAMSLKDLIRDKLKKDVQVSTIVKRSALRQTAQNLGK